MIINIMKIVAGLQKSLYHEMEPIRLFPLTVEYDPCQLLSSEDVQNAQWTLNSCLPYVRVFYLYDPN